VKLNWAVFCLEFGTRDIPSNLVLKYLHIPAFSLSATLYLCIVHAICIYGLVVGVVHASSILVFSKPNAVRAYDCIVTCSPFQQLPVAIHLGETSGHKAA